MNPINSFIFSLRDVIINSLSREILKFIERQRIILNGTVRQTIFDNENNYITERISLEEFFEKTVLALEIEMTATQLEKTIINSIAPILGIFDILYELRSLYPLTLFSQYPPDLLNKISVSPKITELFPERNIIFSNEIGQRDQLDSIIRKVLNSTVTLGKSIWVDFDGRLTSNVMRLGVDAIIFIDSEKLRREIALRGLLPLMGNE